MIKLRNTRLAAVSAIAALPALFLVVSLDQQERMELGQVGAADAGRRFGLVVVHSAVM